MIRERLHQEWLRREAVAQYMFLKRKETEEKIRKEKEEETVNNFQLWKLNKHMAYVSNVV